MTTINLFETTNPVNREELEMTVRALPKGGWDSSTTELDGKSYPIHQVVIPLKINGVKELVELKTFWMEPYPNALCLYSAEIQYTSVKIGEGRYEALKEALISFIQPEWLASMDTASVLIQVSHQWRNWDQFNRNYGWISTEDGSLSRVFLLVQTIDSNEMEDLLDFTYTSDSRWDNKTYRQKLVYYRGGIYNAFIHEEIPYQWVDKTLGYFSTYGDEKDFYPLKQGVFIRIRNTNEVYRFQAACDYHAPFRFFPSSLGGLRDKLSYRGGYLWTELAKVSGLSLTETEVGDLETDGYRLKLYSAKFFEENNTTFKVGDYVQVDKNHFGQITDDTQSDKGIYRVLFEQHQHHEGVGEECHVSKLVQVEPPQQPHQGCLVMSPNHFIGRLVKEGFDYSLVEVLVYERNKIGQRCYGWQCRSVDNKKLCLIESDEWLKSFNMLTLEVDWRPYFEDLAMDYSWSFLNQWLTYCHMFEFKDYNHSNGELEILFYYLLTSLTRTTKYLHLVQELILKSTISSDAYYGRTHSSGLEYPEDKVKRFCSLLMEDVRFKYCFKPYPIQDSKNI